MLSKYGTNQTSLRIDFDHIKKVITRHFSPNKLKLHIVVTFDLRRVDP
jgi:hypothetical protein